MALNITKGVRKGAVRWVLYGVEGVGKTTLASNLPRPIFLDTEESTKQLDVDRVEIADFRALEAAMQSLAKDPQGYQSVIIDSADWAERMLSEGLLKQTGKKSIEDYGFGKGFTMLAEAFARILGEADKLIAAGLHVCFVCHSRVVKVSPPDLTDGYDKYELKLTKGSAPLLKEWADLLTFAKFRIYTKEGNDGRTKALTAKERILLTEHSPAYDAKNRFGLQEELPMEWASIAHIFAGEVPAKPKASATVPTPPTPPPEPEEKKDPTNPIPALLAKVSQYVAADGRCRDHVQKFCEQALVIDETELPAADLQDLVLQLQGIMNTDATVSALAMHLDRHAEAINAYLVKIGWLQAGQGWRDLNREQLELVKAKHANMCRNAGVPVLGGAK